jgi:hypothetical protein
MVKLYMNMIHIHTKIRTVSLEKSMAPMAYYKTYKSKYMSKMPRGGGLYLANVFVLDPMASVYNTYTQLILYY